MTGSGGSRIVATAMMALVLTCAACASPGSTPAVPAAPPTATSESAPSEPVTAPAEKVSKPLDPAAPLRYRPVVRNGKVPQPRVEARKGGFSTAAPVTYPDGVSLTVERVGAGVEQGHGPDAFPGRLHTTISISIHNRSARAINLNQVVVTTMYGAAPARVAAPVYVDQPAEDFSGTIQPGGSASATYAFAIPAGQAGNVVTMVDFDDVHVAAEFVGSAR